MTDTPRRVLVTRPEPGASRTAAALRDAGWQPLLAPMLEIVRSNPALPRPGAVQAVLVTSSNALPAFDPSWYGKPVLAVGGATATAARGRGFADVASAEGDALALAQLVAGRLVPRNGPLLLATAARQGGMLVEVLRAQGFGVMRRAVYAARPIRRLPEAACAALTDGGLAAAFFFSAETARAFSRALTPQLRARLSTVRAISISANVDAALGDLHFAARQIAASPDSPSVLAELRHRAP